MYKKIFCVSTEASGDFLLSHLIKELRIHQQNIKYMGMVGPLSQAQGVELVLDPKHLCATGLVEVISVIPKAYFAIRLVKSYLKEIDLLILCDSPEINMRVIQEADRLKVPYVYIAPPQIWAWRTHRSQKLTQAKSIACLFEFEQKFYHTQGLKAHYIGHPLVEYVQNQYQHSTITQRFEQRIQSLKDQQTLEIAIFPGSRNRTVQSSLSVMLPLIHCLSIKHLYPQIIFKFAFCSWLDPKFKDEILDFAQKHQIDIMLCDSSQDALKNAHFAITHVGTACLEIALHGCPMIILSNLHPISYFVAQHLIQMPYVGLVNLLLGQEVFKEYHRPAHQQKEMLEQICLEIQTMSSKKQAFSDLETLVKNVDFSPIILEILKDLGH